MRRYCARVAAHGDVDSNADSSTRPRVARQRVGWRHTTPFTVMVDSLLFENRMYNFRAVEVREKEFVVPLVYSAQGVQAWKINIWQQKNADGSARPDPEEVFADNVPLAPMGKTLLQAGVVHNSLTQEEILLSGIDVSFPPSVNEYAEDESMC